MKTKFNNLHIGDNDLLGNKFNGHDLHLYLREKGINSSHLVWNKESDDGSTYIIGGNRVDRTELMNNVKKHQYYYALDSLMNPIAYDILYDKLFLDSDIIHLHLVNNYIFDLSLLPLITKLKPVVWTFHDPWILGGHCVHHFDCENWMSHCKDCPYVDKPYLLRKDNSSLNFQLKKLFFERSNLEVVVASEWLKRKMEKSPLFVDKRINVVPFGVNHQIFKPKNKDEVRDKLGIPRDAFVISFRCEYSPFKGLDYVEHVIKNLNSNPNVYFLSVSQYYKKKPRDWRLKEFGWVKDDYLLSEIYNASDVFLMPSKMDTFGMMAVEAMSCGVVPIVLDGTALPDTVNSPYCGFSVKRDKNEYLKTVKLLMKDTDLRNKHSKKCEEFAFKNYNKDIYVEKIISIYNQSLEGFKKDNEAAIVINQLRANMSIESYRGTDNKLLRRFKKFLDCHITLKRFYLILRELFYVADKIIPKFVRRRVKYFLKYLFTKFHE